MRSLPTQRELEGLPRVELPKQPVAMEKDSLFVIILTILGVLGGCWLADWICSIL